MNKQHTAYAIRSMLQCALWSSTDFDGTPFDEGHGVKDFHPATVRALISDLEAFIEAEAADIAASGLTAEQVGHDFWLTRNGHGAGFWDLQNLFGHRELVEIKNRLIAAAKVYGEVDLYIGDDGAIYA
jgi:hypothetical protein